MATTSRKLSLFLGSALLILVGIVAGYLVSDWIGDKLHLSNGSTSQDSQQDSQQNTGTGSEQDNEPLYWVAPMDPNYRRDKPGKSPMGMDLVPVYKEDTAQDAPGTITISPEVENNLAVKTASVTFGRLQQEIEVFGSFTYSEEKLSHIHPRIAGWVEKLHVKTTGQEVKKGQVLYELYSPELVNAQEEFLLSLSTGETNLIVAGENRLRSLHIPQSTIDAIRKSKQVRQTIAFIAPHAGIVENLNIREGYYVELGTTLFSIADLSEIWLEAQVPESQASQVMVGNKVSIASEYLASNITSGVIDYIYPTLNISNRTVRARIRMNNQAGELKPNMFATAKIMPEPAAETMLVDATSIIKLGETDRVVIALGHGKFKSVNVETGLSYNGVTQILSGLEEGEDVVISAQFLLDSESSKTSDFMRMSQQDHSGHMMHGTNMSMSNNMDESEERAISSATVKGIINSYDVDSSIANISRGSIEKWQRGPATMDFVISEAIKNKLPALGTEFTFTFEIHDGEFIVVVIDSQGNGTESLEKDHGEHHDH